MKRNDGVWGSDAPVSMPQPIRDEDQQVDFGGFVFTTGGMAHGITEVDVEAVYAPTFSPEGATIQSGGSA